jgi:hypothetical protein
MITTLKLKKILTGILSLLLMSGAFGQQTLDNNPYILFTGLVLTADSLQPIPYVSINNNRRGMIGYTNEYGHFDVIVKKGDTIWFNQVEKVASWHIIPDTLTQSRYHVVKLLTQDTINLPVIYIRALPLKTLFDYEFVNGDIPDDAYERARKNLEAEALKEQMKLKPADAKESQSLLAQTRASQLYYYKQAPPQNYLNPFVWAQFLEAWKRGDFKKKKKK